MFSYLKLSLTGGASDRTCTVNSLGSTGKQAPPDPSSGQSRAPSSAILARKGVALGSRGTANKSINISSPPRIVKISSGEKLGRNENGIPTNASAVSFGCSFHLSFAGADQRISRGSVVRQLGTLRRKCPGVGRFNGTTDVVQFDQIDQIAVV